MLGFMPMVVGLYIKKKILVIFMRWDVELHETGCTENPYFCEKNILLDVCVFC